MPDRPAMRAASGYLWYTSAAGIGMRAHAFRNEVALFLIGEGSGGSEWAAFDVGRFDCDGFRRIQCLLNRCIGNLGDHRTTGGARPLPTRYSRRPVERN